MCICKPAAQPAGTSCLRLSPRCHPRCCGPRAARGGSAGWRPSPLRGCVRVRRGGQLLPLPVTMQRDCKSSCCAVIASLPLPQAAPLTHVLGALERHIHRVGAVAHNVPVPGEGGASALALRTGRMRAPVPPPACDSCMQPHAARCRPCGLRGCACEPWEPHAAGCCPHAHLWSPAVCTVSSPTAALDSRPRTDLMWPCSSSQLKWERYASSHSSAALSRSWGRARRRAGGEAGARSGGPGARRAREPGSARAAACSRRQRRALARATWRTAIRRCPPPRKR